MDSYPNTFFNLEDSQDYSPSLLFSNPTQDYVTETPQSSRNVGKESRGNKWDVAEDIAFMSAWCFVSENKIRGKNQKIEALWGQVRKLYEEAQKENPQKIGIRNENQMRGRFKRLNENGQKWVAAYREAYRRKRSGMSLKDVENDAHKIYEQECKCKFNDSIVFYEVMCKHPKWDLQLNCDTTRPHPECEVGFEESGGSTKRSRTTEEGDYCVNFIPETPTSGGSTINRPTRRDGAKKKGKGKASHELVEELHSMRLSKDSEVEIMRKKLEVDQQKIQYKQKRDQKMQELKQKKNTK